MEDFSQPDLAALARQQFITAHSSCGDCLPYHALWPYLRLTGRVGGVEADQHYLTPLLREVLGCTRRRVLIAGSADTGVTALVHHAAGLTAGLHDITVVDRCDTPLAACRQYGLAHGLRITTVQSDLRALAVHETADVIVGHSILPFLDADGRHAVLCRLQDALAPGGRMVLTTRLAAAGQSSGASSHQASGWAVETRSATQHSLQRLGIAPPCPSEAFDALLQNYAQRPNHAGYGAPYTSRAELEAELASAGFWVEQWVESGKGTAFLDNGHVQKNARQGLVAVTFAKVDTPKSRA